MIDRPLLAPPERVPSFDILGWVLRIAVCAVFVGVGLTKFSADSMWVSMFARIGFGDWFRYLTGIMQVTGGLLFLFPKTIYAGALLTGATMTGAIVAHFTVLRTGFGGAIIPLALLIFMVVVALRRAD